MGKLTVTVFGMMMLMVTSAVADPGLCKYVFLNYTRTQQVLKEATSIPPKPMPIDDFDIEMGRTPYKTLSAPLKLSDAEFIAQIAPRTGAPAGNVEAEVKLGKTVEEIFRFKEVTKREPELPSYYKANGQVDVTKFTKTNLSLENGRQKLDTVRINFAKSFPNGSREVLRDYLLAARKIPYLKIIILTDYPKADQNGASKSEIEQILKNQPKDVLRRVEVVYSDKPVWVWAQDGSKPIDLPRTTLGMDGKQRYSEGNKVLEDSGKISFQEDMPFTLQGGNTIVGDRHIFIGRDDLHGFLVKYQLSESEGLKILSEIFQKQVLPAEIKSGKWIKEAWSFHIDLDFVLALDHNNSSREVALVRSPEAFLTSMTGEKVSEEASIQELEGIRNKILADFQTRMEKGEVFSSGTKSFIQFLGITHPDKIQISILKSRFFKRLLGAYGYQTLDMPGFGDVFQGKKIFFGTNAVLSEKFAIIPGNDFPEIDRPIQEVYKSLGYEVIPMKSSSTTICQQGGIRCVTETFRKPYLIYK